jgi:putative iron-regulated protein
MRWARILPPAFFLAAALSAAADDWDALKQEVVAHYSHIAEAGYADAVAGTEKLRVAVGEFVAAPDQKKLDAARSAWIAARRPYLQTEVMRYYAGPIDDDDGPEPLINSWPLDESYIDDPARGIIARVGDFPRLTSAVLKDLNQREGEKNVSAGFHAVEFLLWGQDRSKDGPGQRPWTDFTTAPNAKRRGEYLLACADLLLEELKYVAADWAPDKLGNYRAMFEEGFDVSVQRIITGMCVLSAVEIAGERLQVAYDTQEQEEEHSCFSDTTHLDMVSDAQGIFNIWTGEYTRTDGTKISGKGLKALAGAVDAKLAAQIERVIGLSVEKARKIPAPFDQAIRGDDDAPGRKAIHFLIISLEDQDLLLRDLARKLGYDIPKGDEIDAEK